MLPILPSIRDTLFPQSSSSRYRPLGQIGRGGMAEVILAENHARDQRAPLAVLKRIWPHLAADPAFLAMFRHEARICMGLNHPNIVKIYELLEDSDRPAIAMEYLDGQPLSRVLNRLVGPDALSMTLRIRIAANVLRALHYAHELTDDRGDPWRIVHRDVNPQNVFITYDGEIKLVDFGVAKSLSSVDHPNPRLAPGKLAYMAPEQLKGKGVDRRADVFSVGVMLWEMAAGRRLWKDMSEATIVRHLSKPVPLPSLPSNAAIPSGLDEIVARALSHDAERRYRTAGEFASALDALIPGTDEAHGRRLGHVVSLAFANERSARRELIERQSLRPARPTPVGMWSLNEITPSRATSGVTRHRTRWAALGVGLAATMILLIVVPRLKRVASADPATTPTPRVGATATATATVGINPIVVSPLPGRSIIPWPLLPGTAPRTSPTNDGASVLASPERTGASAAHATTSRSHAHSRSDIPADVEDDILRARLPPLPADDDVLPPSVDLRP